MKPNETEKQSITDAINHIKLAMAVISDEFHKLKFELEELNHKQYTRFDMLSFAEYMISDDRKKMFIKPEFNGLSKAESMKMVWHSDIENWKYMKEQNKPTTKNIVCTVRGSDLVDLAKNRKEREDQINDQNKPTEPTKN